MKTVEFVSYTGNYPALCFGVVTIRIGDDEYTLDNLSTGGSVSFDES